MNNALFSGMGKKAPLLIWLFPVLLGAQTVDVKDGVRVVHNVKGGVWGATPKVHLQLLRKIGDVDSLDENLAFNKPGDVAEDKDGNIYLADPGDCRIRKFDREGKFLSAFGRKGQGPGEFAEIHSLDIESSGRLHVLDGRQRRIQVLSAEGKEIRTILLRRYIDKLRVVGDGRYLVSEVYPGIQPVTPKMLLKVIDEKEAVHNEFCLPVDFGEVVTNQVGNSINFAAGRGGSSAAAFIYQNRIEKYSPDGDLVWRANRPLNFETKVLEKGKFEATADMTRTTSPKMNSCSRGIAFDDQGRIWVVTYRRQIKPEEVIRVSQIASSSGITVKRTGDTDLRTTDMYQLDIFESDGVFLGAIALTHFVDGIWIFKDRLYLLDRDRGVTYHQYRIEER